MKPTANAKKFMDANDQHRVYSGWANETGGGGGYTLTNEQTFRLTLKDCRSLPEAYPKWVDFERTV